MRPRFVGRVGLADVATLTNAALGFAAAAVAVIDVGLAARLILLAGIADGVDGVIARARGGSAIGEQLDSLADVASFGVAPALFVFAVGRAQLGTDPLVVAALVAVPALFVAAAVLRLGLYTVYDADGRRTEGVQTTLAATILATMYLAGLTDARLLVAATGLFAYLMVTDIGYPELFVRDQLVMGGLQALALLAPTVAMRAFPRALLVGEAAYLLLAPRFYWRETDAGGAENEGDPESEGDAEAADTGATAGPRR
jgi:CDP-diacylglycerol--serine O-phosphatidyltransferase